MKIHVGNTLTSFREKPFHIDLDRSEFRHPWLLGKSGTGKSTLLRNIIVAAIREGFGIAIIDPHGDLVFDAVNYVPESQG
jgi:DNA helicase HerA-like ATPase